LMAEPAAEQDELFCPVDHEGQDRHLVDHVFQLPALSHHVLRQQRFGLFTLLLFLHTIEGDVSEPFAGCEVLCCA
jgi:hypothetical protein